MNPSGKRAIQKKRGRGRPATGNDPVRAFRLSDEFMARLDAWIAEQDDRPSRAEAIRRLVELGLTVRAKIKQGSAARAERAKELASKTINNLTADTPESNEKASRKGRLIKGPEEFREARVDRPKGK
jgi:Arc/MetJ-type ribon-helix-helix transcriptional regulator